MYIKRQAEMLLWALAMSSPIWADEQADSVAWSLDLATLEVSGVRATEDVPVAYTDFSQEDIAQNAETGRDVPYLLQASPSVVATSDAGNGMGYTELRMRGYDGTRINVTANGVPLNDAESHRLYWVDVPDLVSSAQSLQLQRGAGVSTAGSGAFGGAINLSTQAPLTEFEGRIDVSYGSFNTNREALHIASGLLGKHRHWSVQGRLSHLYSDGYIERAFTDQNAWQVQAAYQNERTLVKLLNFGGTECTYNAWDGITQEQMEKDRRYNPCGEIQDAFGKVIGFYDKQTDNYVQVNNQLVINHQFTSHWALDATLHYTYGDGYYNQYKNRGDLSTYLLTDLHDAEGHVLKKSNLIRKKSMYNHFAGALMSAHYVYSRVNLSFGGSYNAYTGEHYGQVTDVISAVDFQSPYEYYRNNSLKQEATAYAKLQLRMVSQFYLYADVQYRWVSQYIAGTDDCYDYTKESMQPVAIDKIYQFINPKLGLLYKFAHGHKVQASFAVANREPTRKDLINAYAGQEPRPERLYDVEASYSYTSDYIVASLGFFYMIYKDQLVMTGEQNPDTYEALYMNIPNSYRRGLEIEVSGSPCSWFSLGGNVSLSQNRAVDFTEYISNNDTWQMESNYLGTTNLAYSPSVVSTIHLDFHTHGFKAVWQHRYIGKQYITNTSNENLTLPGYYVSDLHLSYDLKLKRIDGIQFGVSLCNLFNAAYCSNATASSWIADGVRRDVAYYQPQAQFNAMGHIRVTF